MTIARSISRHATLGAAALLTVVGVLVGVPDANDFVLATTDKHQRLESLAGPKVVFVGGSNLAYGLDSRSVDAALPHGVVNMGLNAYLGARFLLREVDGALTVGDVAVLSFEHRMFFTYPEVDFADGMGIDHLMVIKARPRSVTYLSTSGQALDIMRAVPLVSQRKLDKVGRQILSWSRGRPLDESPEVGTLQWVEGSRHAFNEYGDMWRHVDPRAVKPPLVFDHSVVGQQLRDDVFAELRRFKVRMDERGVSVLFAPPPTPWSYYLRQRAQLDLLYDRLATEFPGLTRLDASGLLFPDTEFFDAPSHLGTAASRTRRTALVIEQLRRVVAPNSVRRRTGATAPE